VNVFSRRSLPRTLAVAAVVVLGASACTSDPTPKRVAEDLIRTLAETPEIEECMLEVLDGYSSDQLEDIGKNVTEGDLDEQAAANAALAEYEADLTACRE
jgi:hypothetical protein